MGTNETEQRDAFLSARPRFAMLTTLRADGSPVTVPVWYRWDGSRVLMFAAADSAKLRRLERDPRVTVLVANDVDEPEFWVSFDGEVSVEAEGGFELAEQLAPDYWDLTDPERAAVLEQWRVFAEGLRLMVLTPSRIRTYRPD